MNDEMKDNAAKVQHMTPDNDKLDDKDEFVKDEPFLYFSDFAFEETLIRELAEGQANA